MCMYTVGGANCSILRNKFKQDTLKLNGLMLIHYCTTYTFLSLFKGFRISIFDFHLIRKFVQLPESIHAICCYLTHNYCLNKFIQPCAFTSFELFVLSSCVSLSFFLYLHIACNVCKYFISEIELGIRSTRIKTVYLTIACLKRICLF